MCFFTPEGFTVYSKFQRRFSKTPEESPVDIPEKPELKALLLRLSITSRFLI